MDLFLASGIALGDGGPGGVGRQPSIRMPRTPLLKHKMVAGAIKPVDFKWTERQLAAAKTYAQTVRSRKFSSMKETAVRPLFFEKILGDLLGYVQVRPEGPHTLAFEYPLRGGSVDVALGRFGEDADRIVAPFEMKGPGTDLDAVMPGRGRSPVQQAWDYANDAPGCRWVLVSNCVEIRLYGFGRGRDAYESFDLSRIDEAQERERLWFLLAAERLLEGATEALLRESDTAYRTVTDELYREYSALRERLIDYLANEADGPKLKAAGAIEPAQKILDRILFIAFAERTQLLPPAQLEGAKTTVNKYNPQPLWGNFRQLFRAVDEGNQRLNIWPYNGNLFKRDAVVDEVELPDHLSIDLAKLGEWDYRDDVPVTMLGHLFEKSVTDLEAMRAKARGLPAPKVGKKKKEGVVYTPDIVTRFLIAKTLGLTLAERFDALLTKHGRSRPKNGDPIFVETESEQERAFWSDYVAALRSLRIVDPACGSGAFLVAAFDFLAGEYARVARRLADLKSPLDFDPFDEIVTRNLYGVDLNTESVEITRLGLWLKTARYQRKLQNLEPTIRVGNSLIDDPAYTEHPFDWREAFPEVFKAGGFDIVIGNPPYVRMEFVKPFKPYLEKKYAVAADRADLYAYFFEKGVDILKDGGRLGFISSSTFFRTGSGENLRTFLGDRAAVEAIVDFGDVQIFEGVTTYPAILTLKKGDAPADGSLAFMKIEDAPDDLEAEFKERARPMPHARLGSGTWQLEEDALARLRDKIVTGRKTLGEVYGAPMRGIVTGLNDAFIIDQETRDRLVKRDANSGEILVPFLRGENIKRWRVEPEGLFLINTPKGNVDIDKYPAVRDWLLPFKKDLEARATKQEWFELQQAQLAYQDEFAAPKIAYQDIAASNPFTLDAKGYYLANTCYFIPSADASLLSYLNSKAVWFLLSSITNIARGGYLRLRTEFVKQTPVPKLSVNRRLPELGNECSAAAVRMLEVLSAVRHRISADLGARAKLSRKLEDWHLLDFQQFLAEAKRAFKAEITPKQRPGWEEYLREEGEKVRALTAGIEAAEREIDKIVYGLFDLTPDEVALLESSIEGRH